MRSTLTAAVAAVVLAALAAGARAEDLDTSRDLHVPRDFRFLQDALDAAEPGDRVIVHRGTYGGPFRVVQDDIRIEGRPGARLLGVRGTAAAPGRPALEALGRYIVVRGITFVGGGVRVEGDDARVYDCAFRRLDDTERTTTAISVAGDRATVQGNAFGLETRTYTAIEVSGASATVTGNRLRGRRVVRGIAVTGAGAILRNNSVRLGRTGSGIQPVGIAVVGDGAHVSSSDIRNGCLSVAGNRAAVRTNSVTESGLGVAAIHVQGDDGSLEFNEVRGSLDTAFLVVGDRCGLTGNSAEAIGSRFGEVAYGHGFVIRGSDNIVVYGSVAGCLGEGFRIAGGTGNSLAGCDATGAGVGGLVNRTTGTEVLACAFLQNAIDVVDYGELVRFESTEFESGGPGVPGPGDPEVPDVAVPEGI